MEVLMSKTRLIQEAIFSAVSGKVVVSWSEIMDAVNNDGIKINDWRQVRNVMHQFVVANLLSRTEDLSKEEYQIDEQHPMLLKK
jgi:Fe2+ or Zn2+ uptake regulation protein